MNLIIRLFLHFLDFLLVLMPASCSCYVLLPACFAICCVCVLLYLKLIADCCDFRSNYSVLLFTFFLQESCFQSCCSISVILLVGLLIFFSLYSLICLPIFVFFYVVVSSSLVKSVFFYIVKLYCCSANDFGLIILSQRGYSFSNCL